MSSAINGQIVPALGQWQGVLLIIATLYPPIKPAMNPPSPPPPPAVAYLARSLRHHP